MTLGLEKLKEQKNVAQTHAADQDTLRRGKQVVLCSDYANCWNQTSMITPAATMGEHTFLSICMITITVFCQNSSDILTIIVF